jgi:hypothetical protein
MLQASLGWRHEASFMRRLLAALAIAVCVGCAQTSARTPSTPTTVPAPTATATVEYKLATIQANSLPGELLVNQFRHELTKLSAACRQPEISLSDKTVVAHNILFKQGVDASYLDILRDLNTIVADSPPPVACDDVITAYVYLRGR